ncbi:SPOR domain-containing protein [Gimibacter soli]|uniref:Tetratricopeptide repeat protein n=1 Tax=Gimibacter soli TaxID=3024400 RepID=A0AAE9XUD8_9PROT|nr:SPOR domain-containing protein [Gimibacter soli]WCL54710.1 tetratricopeptide repeat protein [Gimibacter soli]
MTTNSSFRLMATGACLVTLAACAGHSTSAGATPDVQAASAAMQSSGATGSLIDVADRLAAEGNHAAAIPLYRSLLGGSDGDRARVGLAASLNATGSPEEAMKVLRSLIDDKNASGDAWHAMGKTFLSLGQFDQALAAFTEASNRMSGDGRPRSGRGIALAALGRLDDAVESFDSAGDTLGQSNKALVLAAWDQPDEAIAILEPIVSNAEGGPRDRQNLAFAYLMAGRDKDAERMARLDLDAATVADTFGFYNAIKSLTPEERMRSLAIGAISPATDGATPGNLRLTDTEDRDAAANRLVTDPASADTVEMMPAAPAAPATPVAEKKPYQQGDIPPLLESEGWALQIAAYRTVKELIRGWDLLHAANQDILNGIEPRRSEVDFGTRDTKPSGFYYRLNAGPLKSLAEARELCNALKANGTDCWIRPPEPSEGKKPTDAE